MSELNHFDKDGRAVMIDVSGKEPTLRCAWAEGSIHVSAGIIQRILQKSMEKGDVLGVARIAGIMAAKQTSSVIPLCHPIALRTCSVDFDINEEENIIKASAFVKTEEKTGVEMEALTAVSASLLTIYDMCKAVDKKMEITGIHLVRKTGGKSGDFAYDG